MVMHLNVGNIVCIFVEDNIIREKEYCRVIGLHGFVINYLKKRRVEGLHTE